MSKGQRFTIGNLVALGLRETANGVYEFERQASQLNKVVQAKRPRHIGSPKAPTIEQITFEALCEGFDIPIPVAEYQFDPSRKWRYDYAWPEHKIALEIEGGVWTNGRHTRGQGFINDMEKYNAGVVQGWRIIRCVPDDLLRSKTIHLIKQLLEWKYQTK